LKIVKYFTLKMHS